MTEKSADALNDDQLKELARYFDEEVTFSKHIGARVEEVEPGWAVIHIDIEDVHLNGSGTLHGGVYASLMDNAMGLAVLALVGTRTATIEMNTHFLGSVNDGRIVCRSEVVHRTRRTATAESKVYDADGNLVAMGTGAFRVFEKKGNAIV
ncbi:MAG: PaaI family thioesterase [Rubrobacteraceae bacterium]